MSAWAKGIGGAALLLLVLPTACASDGPKPSQQASLATINRAAPSATAFDVLDPDEGNDVIDGGDGDDFVLTDLGSVQGNDIFDGGKGTDEVSYISAGAAVTVDLTLTGPQPTGGGGSDSFADIENLVGTLFGDRLTGNGSANVLDGYLGGADVLRGGSGPDRLLGGPGSDSLFGEAHNDVLEGGPETIGLTVAPEGTHAAQGPGRTRF